MGFGKPGRPREDRLARQQQIFGGIRGLLVLGRVRTLTMAKAARQANMSVGGLYHYFPSKRDLVLFGIDPRNLERVCADFRLANHCLAQGDPRALLSKSLDTLAFVDPAMSNQELRRQLQATVDGALQSAASASRTPAAG